MNSPNAVLGGLNASAAASRTHLSGGSRQLCLVRSLQQPWWWADVVPCVRGMARRAPGAAGGSLSSPFNWRLLVLVSSAFLVLIFTCSQLVILGNDCRLERERAVHAEDLLLQSQSAFEQTRQALEKQVEELKSQALDAGPEFQLREVARLRTEVQRLQAQDAELRKENAWLKDLKASKAVDPPHQEHDPKVIDRLPAVSTEITEETLRMLASKGAIGVAIITCKRPKYLTRAMDSIFRAPRDPSMFPLVISQDAYDAPMRELVQKNYVKTGQAFHMHHEHDPNAKAVAAKFGGNKQALGYVLIAQHFGFVMKRMFEEFGFEAVIFLEEDLEVSPDFFSYFEAMKPILRNDKDLFCVSAWNDNGYQNLVLDPKAAFRTDFFPGLGWMMDKDLWDELRNHWAVAYWDEYMRRPDIRKHRHCIRPEISRSFTFGEEGGVSGGQFFKGHLGKIKLNDVMVDWSKQDLSHLVSAKAFDDYLTAQISAAVQATTETVDSFSTQSKVLRIEYEDPKYKATVAKKFGLMPDEKEGIRRMSYRGVIPMAWLTNRIYLHTRNWPHLK